MNVASQPLCQELYELLGWGKNDRIQWYKEIAVMGVGKDTIVAGLHQAGTGNTICPAYTLGYLMRKLPGYVKLFRNNHGVYYAAAVTGSFRHPDNQLGAPDTAHEWYTAPTPEDALVMLAIELAKAGILKRGES